MNYLVFSDLENHSQLNYIIYYILCQAAICFFLPQRNLFLFAAAPLCCRLLTSCQPAAWYLAPKISLFLSMSMVHCLRKMPANTTSVIYIRICALSKLIPNILRHICVPSDLTAVVQSYLQNLPLGIVTDSVDIRAAETESFY